MAEDLWKKYGLVPAVPDVGQPGPPPASASADPWAQYELTPATGIEAAKTEAPPEASTRAPTPKTVKTEIGEINLGSPAARFGIGAGQGLMGLGQLWAHKGADVAESIAGPDNAVVRGGRKLGGLFDIGAQRFADWARAGREAAGYEAEPELLKPSTWDPAQTAGDVLSPVNIAAGGIGRAAAGGGKLLQGAAHGLGYAAAQPVTARDTQAGETYDEAKRAQLIAGAIGGGLGAKITSKIGDVVGPKLSDAVTYLHDRNVRLTPGQGLQGWWRRGENLLRSTPVSGEMVREAQQQSTSDFNRAAYNETLGSIGESLPKDVGSWRNAMGYLHGRTEKAYNDVHQNLRAWMEPQLMSDLSRIVRSQPGEMSPAEVQQLTAYLKNNVVDRFRSTNYLLDGKEIQAMMSTIKKSIRNFYGDGGNPRMARALDEAREAIDDMLERQNPNLVKRLRAVNKAYAQSLILDRATSYPEVGQHGGEFTPDQLARAVGVSTTRRRRSEGEALLQKLAEAGQQAIPSRVPDSTTLERISLMGLLGIGAYHGMAPEAAIGVAGVGAAYHPLSQWALRQAIAGGHKVRRPVGDFIREHGPMAGVPAVVNYLRNNKQKSKAY